MKLPDTILKFATIFKNNNFSLFLVGGAVRDALLGEEQFDYDFTTDATPEQVMSIFKKVIPVGIDHGTVLVLFGNSE
ncbi:MAG TPA: polynucleotide adenylyltransferase, partial [Spirochaetia bacterium]|nr:polynucleotide adenylyltransferase [Spirochaetia bacterium]